MSAAPAGGGYTVAVLGLGAMGLGMAQRLATVLAVQGYDISAERVALARGHGVVPAASAREAVTGADAVVLAVRDARQLQDVLLGENGVAASLKPGAVVPLTSTVGVDEVRATAEQLEDVGVALVDAPLSSGPISPRPSPQRRSSCSGSVRPWNSVPPTTPPSSASSHRHVEPAEK